MFLKTVFLLSISAVLAYHHLQDTPEDLKELFDEVFTQVTGLQHETMIEIRTNVVPLAMYIDEAKTGLFLNLTEAAKPYWANISSLTKDAETNGQNITDCLYLGNEQIYALNNSIANNAQLRFSYYNQTGNDILDHSSVEAYSVIEELLVFDELVQLCNDDTCATDLKKLVTQYYQRAKSTLIDAETKARNYVQVALPVLLNQYSLDVSTYVSNYTVFINDIVDCINKL